MSTWSEFRGGAARRRQSGNVESDVDDSLQVADVTSSIGRGAQEASFASAGIHPV